MQYIGRLFRPRHPAKWGIVIALCLLIAVGSALTAIYAHMPLFYIGVGLALIALGLASFILLGEMCWCEMSESGIAIKNPFGEVTSLAFDALEAVSIRRYGQEDWYILWDGRPLSYRLRGRRWQNHPHVAVRIPKTVESEAFLSRIPIPAEKQKDRDLLREALVNAECTFLWRDTVYEVTRLSDGHLALWAEQDDNTVMVGRFVNLDDLTHRALLHNTPISVLLAESTTFAMSKTLREDVVKAMVTTQYEQFATSSTLKELRTLAEEAGHQVMVRKYLLRPAPTISYEGGIAVDVLDGEGKPLLINDEHLSYDLSCVVADELGHLDVYPWEDSREFAIFLAIAKQVLRIKANK